MEEVKRGLMNEYKGIEVYSCEFSKAELKDQ